MGMVKRALVASGGLVLVAVVADPHRPRMALGVLGGLVLAGISYWGIRSGVDGLLRVAPEIGSRRTRSAALVKFFTRFAILGVAAYGMMARLRLDPIGMLIGVSALALVACMKEMRPWSTKPGR
jgi:hypothetical protein